MAHRFNEKHVDIGIERKHASKGKEPSLCHCKINVCETRSGIVLKLTNCSLNSFL